SFALGQPVQPGPANRARDMDDELGRSRLLGNERGGGLNRGSARTGQRAPGNREKGERNRGENERPLARHGQGGHVSSGSVQKTEPSATQAARRRRRDPFSSPFPLF